MPGMPDNADNCNGDPTGCYPPPAQFPWWLFTPGAAGLYTFQTEARAQAPQSHPVLSRAGVCAKTYFGLDSFSSGAENIAGRGALWAAAFPLSKSWLTKLGIRATRFGGASGWTNILSVAGQGAGTAAKGTNVLRIFGRVAGPIAIASGVIDLTSIGVCTFIDQ
jgi:hypothetical protein